MASVKIAISIDEKALKAVDRLVAKSKYASRSRAITEAVQEHLLRLNKGRFARECAKLDPHEERQMAEEILAGEVPWPKY
jgi:metal-responsive CopG/Arc/MetJ family transcriptional regulator